MQERRRTYFVDLDGVIVQHLGTTASDQWHPWMGELCNGVHEWLDAREKEGAVIVLCTARKECCRADVEMRLRNSGVYWDHLVMGLGNGLRILINDVKAEDFGRELTAVAVNLKRNEGLSEDLR